MEERQGIKPIAVGCTLQRLAAKSASAHAVKVKELPGLLALAPHQLWLWVSCEVEGAVHAARFFLRALIRKYYSNGHAY